MKFANAFTENRAGRVRIALDIMHSTSDEALSAAFSNIFIIKTKVLTELPSVIEYSCVSPKFEPVEVGGIIPLYTLWITIHPEFGVQITFEKQA